jgi:hypothetical protein
LCGAECARAVRWRVCGGEGGFVVSCFCNPEVSIYEPAKHNTKLETPHSHLPCRGCCRRLRVLFGRHGAEGEAVHGANVRREGVVHHPVLADHGNAGEGGGDNEELVEVAAAPRDVLDLDAAGVGVWGERGRNG